MHDQTRVLTDRPGHSDLLSASRWLRILGTNTAGAVIVTGLLAVLGSQWSLSANLTVSLIYANAIGIPAALLLPPLARRLAGRPALLWPGLLGTLLALAVAGSLVASLSVMAIGVVPPERMWAAWAFGLKIAVLVTLGIGVAMFLYESTRARLDQATLELKTKELERERAEKLATEARLAALEARLNPHFLFNTLTAISGLIHEDQERAERLVGRLAGLLRFALSATERRWIPLEEELDLLTGYLEIEQARLGPRLRYEIAIPQGLRQFPVPPLSLHTLVENSVRHVAAARREGGRIRIDAWPLNDRLTLSVWDDGPGFRLEEVPSGHGLDTLSQRLAALYGQGAELGITYGDRAKWVTLSLPRPRGLPA